MYDVYFINECNDKGIIISEMKLQCFLFLAKGYTYAFDGKELFKDHFEKWGHHAVIPKVWKKYRGHISMNIPKEVEYEYVIINNDNHLEVKTCYFNKFDIDQNTRDTLDAVIDAFRNSSAIDIINMLSEELPYTSTSYNEIISEKLIKNHYIHIINEQASYNTQHKTKSNKEKQEVQEKTRKSVGKGMKQILIKYNEDWRTIFADSVEDVIESMQALRDVARLSFVFKKVNENTIEVHSTKK